MDQTTHEVRLANWTATIKECQSRPKGQTTKQWLEEHDISDKQYYYWLRKVRQNAFAEMSQNLPASQVKQLPAPALRIPTAGSPLCTEVPFYFAFFM